MNKKVSILVPIYNVEKFVNRCIDSILEQTYKNFELILVDDCSTDNSLNICYEYTKKDDRIKVIKKPTHTVLSDVRNIGIENSTGDYIMFVDSDDYVCNNFLEEMVKAIEEKKVDVVRCKALKYKKDGKYEVENFFGYEDQVFIEDNIKNIIPNFVTSENNISCYSWALIIKKESLKIRFNSSVYCRQDTVFFIELLLKSVKSIYFLDKPLYHYCYNISSITKDSDNYYRYLDGIIISDNELRKVLVDYNVMNEELARKINYTVFQLLFYRVFKFGNLSINNIKNIVKNTFEKEELKKYMADMDISKINYKSKIKYYLVKFRLYFVIAILIKCMNK